MQFTENIPFQSISYTSLVHLLSVVLHWATICLDLCVCVCAVENTLSQTRMHVHKHTHTQLLSLRPVRRSSSKRQSRLCVSPAGQQVGLAQLSRRTGLAWALILEDTVCVSACKCVYVLHASLYFQRVFVCARVCGHQRSPTTGGLGG